MSLTVHDYDTAAPFPGCPIPKGMSLRKKDGMKALGYPSDRMWCLWYPGMQRHVDWADTEMTPEFWKSICHVITYGTPYETEEQAK